MTAIIRIVAVIGTALALVATASGLSAADYSGQTYGQASQQITNSGSKPIIASVVGDQLATNDCIVTSAARASNLDSSGRSRGSEILLHLNCNALVASPGVPGNSAASAAGKAAKADITTADWCAEPAQAGNSNCAIWCSSRTAMCEKATAAAAEAQRLTEIKEEKTAEWCALPAQVGNSNCAIFCAPRVEVCETAAAKVVEAAREEKTAG
jgi:hypothetical protein